MSARDYWNVFYNLCDRDDDCERGLDHEGACGLAVRENHEVVCLVDSGADR